MEIDGGLEMVAVSVATGTFLYGGDFRVQSFGNGIGDVRQVEPGWAGKLAGFTLLFEALILTLCREMTFTAVARLVNLSWHQVTAICKRYVDLSLTQSDFSEVKRLAADETSKARGHDYITLVADADQRRGLFVTEGRDAETIKTFAADFTAHGGRSQGC
jgi:transposase